MRTGIFILAALTALLFSLVSGQRSRHLSPEARHVFQWYDLQAAALEEEAALLLEAVEQQDSEPEIQQQYLEMRLAYKQLELLAAHFHPSEAAVLNNLAAEQRLFPHIRESDTAALRKAAIGWVAGVNTLRSMLDSLQRMPPGAPQSELVPASTDARLFDAMREEIARMLAYGIPGHDSPAGGESLNEAKHALAGIKAVWLFYREKIEKLNPGLADHTLQLFAEVHRMLDTTASLSAFSYINLIRDYLNPLAVNIKLSREALRIPYDSTGNFPDPAASHVFAKGAFGADWQMSSRFDRFVRGEAQQMNAQEVKGFNLFMGKGLCGSCHFAPLFNRDKPFGDASPSIRHAVDTLHRHQHLTSAEQQAILAFMKTLKERQPLK